MQKGMKTLVFPTTDLDRAKSLYGTLLGVEPYIDEAYYVGYRAGELELGLDPNGHRHGMTQPVAFWEVDDIEKSIAALREAGAEVEQKIREVGAGKRIARLRDADGNVIGLAQSP